MNYDDQNVLAYELMGDIYYLQQKLADAKENYQIAFALRPQAGLSRLHDLSSIALLLLPFPQEKVDPKGEVGK